MQMPYAQALRASRVVMIGFDAPVSQSVSQPFSTEIVPSQNAMGLTHETLILFTVLEGSFS